MSSLHVSERELRKKNKTNIRIDAVLCSFMQVTLRPQWRHSLSLFHSRTHTQSAHKRVYLIDSSFRWGHTPHVDTKKHTNTHTHTLANVAAGPKIIILPNFSRHTTESRARASIVALLLHLFFGSKHCYNDVRSNNNNRHGPALKHMFPPFALLSNVSRYICFLGVSLQWLLVVGVLWLYLWLCWRLI